MPTYTIEPLNRILFPTDFSPAANLAQAHAERLAAVTGASLLALHVPQLYGTDTPEDTPDDRLRLLLEDIPTNETGLEVERLIYRGSPGEIICWIAQERECDQIVMGTHGRTGLVNLLMGSTAEHVVRHARCPVLTVPKRPTSVAPLRKPAGCPMTL